MAAALAAAGFLPVACDSGPPPEQHPEVYQQVEVRYDRAVRKALAAVPDSRLLSIGLRDTSGPEPRWRVLVVTGDGTIRMVRVDAVGGRLLDDTIPAGSSAAAKARTASMVSTATVLPEDAVEKVAPRTEQDPHFGKVTDIRLAHGDKNRLVWSVTVAGVRPDDTHTYQVDAVTADVLYSSADAPSPEAS
jgi:uncharacterized membrane protein YkoI